MTLVGIFFANQVFLTFLLSQKLWFKQSDSSWKEAVKKVQVHYLMQKNLWKSDGGWIKEN